jgi:hypothetical protein
MDLKRYNERGHRAGVTLVNIAHKVNISGGSQIASQQLD